MNTRDVNEENPVECNDERLIAGLRSVLSRQRSMTARLVAFIAEVDARGLYRGFGYASMFEYAVEALHMSEGEAFPRIYAGRITRKYPAVLGMLERGELHLSGVRLIGPLLTADNHAELLDAVRFKSKRDVEKFIASRSPKQDVKSGTRKLPERTPAEPPIAALPLRLEPAREQADTPSPPRSLVRPAQQADSDKGVQGNAGSRQSDDDSGSSARAPAIPPAPANAAPLASANGVPGAVAQVASGAQDSAVQSPGVVPAGQAGCRLAGATLTPLRADRYKVQFTADQTLHDKIKQAQHLLRGQLPSGDLAEIVERALDLLIAERMKQHFAVGSKPAAAKAHAQRPAQPSRHIPHDVRRQVFARDGMQCTYVSADGRRCEQCGDLEFHHAHPFARGGEASVANIRLLCSAHNALLAEQDYGRAFIRQRIDDLPRGMRDAAMVLERSAYARGFRHRCIEDASEAAREASSTREEMTASAMVRAYGNSRPYSAQAGYSSTSVAANRSRQTADCLPSRPATGVRAATQAWAASAAMVARAVEGC